MLPKNLAPSPALAPTAPNGLGVLCAEAQADGVPCACLETDCAICERYLQRMLAGWTEAAPPPGQAASVRAPH